MPGTRLVYWDVGPFLRYVERDPDWINIVSPLLDESASRQSDLHIVTSTLTVAQVAYRSDEKGGELSDAAYARIKYVLEDRDAVTLAEFHQLTASGARDLVRTAIERGWNSKVEDMIHLASAKQEGVSAIHTLDTGLDKWADDLGIPVLRPVVDQPKLLDVQPD